MMERPLQSLLLLVAGLVIVANAKTFSNSKIVCYYNSRAHAREGQGKFEVANIEPALSYCTHLIYGYAAISEETFKLVPLNDYFDTVQDNYMHVTNLKRNYPNLKVILSVGGNEDISGDGDDKNLKYRTLIESSAHRLSFVNSAHTLLKAFNFDGLDLAWQFPETKPKKIRSTLGAFWKKVKTTVAGESVVDENAGEHRDQFITFVREIKNVLRPDNLLLSISVLPNVNSTVYYDPRTLSPNLDFVNILAYDFYKPSRNPKEADYPAPLYELIDRKYDENADYQVKYWTQNGAPANKLVLGIPAYGRAWKMTSDSSQDGIPPLLIDGPAPGGPYTKDAGILSYPEICQIVSNVQQNNRGAPSQYRKVVDPTNRKELYVLLLYTPPGELESTWGRPTVAQMGHMYKGIDLKSVYMYTIENTIPGSQDSARSNKKGTYFYRLPDSSDEGGIWVGYDDIEMVKAKVNYAKAKGLSGVSLNDLSMDDFRGGCSIEKYPILRAIKTQL